MTVWYVEEQVRSAAPGPSAGAPGLVSNGWRVRWPWVSAASAAAVAARAAPFIDLSPGLVLLVVGTGGALAAASRCWRVWVCLGLVVAAGSWRGTEALASFDHTNAAAFHGWAEVASDPMPVGRGLRVTLAIEGRRYDAWLYGSPRRRMVDRQAGQWVAIEGNVRPLSADQRTSSALSRHVVGRADIERVTDWWEGGAITRANTRIRLGLRRAAAAAMSEERAALFTGLVIGDDAAQPSAMVADFRASGLSHLTAVSGQNVAYVLLACAPILRRLRPAARWAATLGVIVWFMALTRFEPSVLRAGAMAMVVATAFVRGRRIDPVIGLAATVVVLVLADPLLAWSVGFWLSVGATAGIAVVGVPLATTLPGPIWVRGPLALTLGAQIGVALPSLLVFGRLPIVSLVTNLLAAPVAGAVMLYGLPAGLLAAVVPPVAPWLLAPCRAAVAWVDIVAALGARVEPPRIVGLATWVTLALWALVRHRRRRGYPAADVRAPDHRR